MPPVAYAAAVFDDNSTYVAHFVVPNAPGWLRQRADLDLWQQLARVGERIPGAMGSSSLDAQRQLWHLYVTVPRSPECITALTEGGVPMSDAWRAAGGEEARLQVSTAGAHYFCVRAWQARRPVSEQGVAAFVEAVVGREHVLACTPFYRRDSPALPVAGNRMVQVDAVGAAILRNGPKGGWPMRAPAGQPDAVMSAYRLGGAMLQDSLDAYAQSRRRAHSPGPSAAPGAAAPGGAAWGGAGVQRAADAAAAALLRQQRHQQQPPQAQQQQQQQPPAPEQAQAPQPQRHQEPQQQPAQDVPQPLRSPGRSTGRRSQTPGSGRRPHAPASARSPRGGGAADLKAAAHRAVEGAGGSGPRTGPSLRGSPLGSPMVSPRRQRGGSDASASAAAAPLTKLQRTDSGSAAAAVLHVDLDMTAEPPAADGPAGAVSRHA